MSLRHPRHRAILALSAALVAGFRATLRGMDFVEIQTPKLVGAATFVTFNPTSPFTEGYTTLPVQIYQYFARAQEEYKVLAAAGLIVMLVVLVAMNSFAVWLRNRYEQKW